MNDGRASEVRLYGNVCFTDNFAQCFNKSFLSFLGYTMILIKHSLWALCGCSSEYWVSSPQYLITKTRLFKYTENFTTKKMKIFR